jgi:predicted Zn-dependent protease
MSGDDDEKLTDAAVRALTRARDDAPERVELLEALSAVELRRGRADAAKAHADAARHLAPERPRVYAMLSEALRALGDRTGARAVLDEGLERAGKSPLLVVERALVAAEAGDFALAEQMLSALLDEHPLFAPAFVHLTSLLAHRRDTVAMARLVDAVLSELMRHTGEADRAVSPDVLRRAMELTVAFEPEGVARSARVERLGQALVVLAPEDAWAKFELARALSEVGDRAQAVSLLADVQRLAPRSSLAAEAARARFALEHPEEAHAIELAMRHAQEADTEALADIAVGAHRMAMVHGIWTAHLAAAIAERRRGRAATARKVLDVALATAPGCAPALAEAVRVSLEEGDARAAVGYAERLSDAERESPRSLALLALAFAKDGNEERARRVFARAKAQDAFDPTVAEVGLALERLLERSADGAPSSRRAGPSGSSRPGGEGPIERVRALLRRFGRGG